MNNTLMKKRNAKLNGIQMRVKATELLKERGSIGFKGFVNRVNPKFKWYKHNEIIADIVERVVAGELKNVMVFMPPRHGKSEELSRLASVYYLSKHPDHFVGLTSYAAELAFDLSFEARNNYVKSGKKIVHDKTAVSNWKTPEGGGFWAAGVGGPITGKGFHFGIVDDPIKNKEEAYSDTVRDGVITWWQTTFWTRREPDAATLVIMTRWHHGDLAGWLLSNESEFQNKWHIVNYEALKTSDEFPVPNGCTLEPDWREPGEALCPQRYSIWALSSIRKNLGSRFWEAMYQQRPTAEEGDVWKEFWFKSFSISNDRISINDLGRYWDTAETDNEENAAIAYVEAGMAKIDGQDCICITDCGWQWLEVPEALKYVKSKQVPHYIEAKSSGKSLVQFLEREGIYAVEVEVHSDKVARARLASPVAERGQVYIEERIFRKLLSDKDQGILFFPGGKHKDLADAFSMALTRLTKPLIIGEIGKRVQVAPSELSQAVNY
jgi:predicted phage terminase large subunit-like protein